MDVLDGAGEFAAARHDRPHDTAVHREILCAAEVKSTAPRSAATTSPTQPTQPWSFADISKLKKLTNWQSTTDLTSGINKTIFNLKKNIKD